MRHRSSAEQGTVHEAVTATGGVARVATLLDAGFTRHTIDVAVRAGVLLRPRRGWVSVPTADPLLVSAARHGVVLTCITQAARLGLWTLEVPGVAHVGAPSNLGRAASARAHVHWAQPAVPRHPDALVDPIENVLVLSANCLPYEQALAVWESAFHHRAVDPLALSRLKLPPAARRLLENADIYSDSGLETLVVPRLRWLGLPLRRQIHIAGHRVDLLIAERLVLQIDGGHHVGAQRTQDIAHDAQLRLLGYHVIRVSYTQVVEGWAEVQDMIMRAVAQGLHRA